MATSHCRTRRRIDVCNVDINTIGIVGESSYARNEFRVNGDEKIYARTIAAVPVLGGFDTNYDVTDARIDRRR